MIRAFAFPIAAPGVEWKVFDADMRAMWQESTRLANWTVTELLKNEAPPLPGDKKLGKMTPIYLYGLAKSKYPSWGHWEGSRASACSVMRAVEKKYRKSRIDVIWRRSAVAPTYRYPYPYPIHNQSWSAEIIEGAAFFNVNLNATRYQLRLRGGPQFRRQLAGLEAILAGTAKKCEASIYRKGDHTMVKIVGKFPDTEPKTGRLMLVSRATDAFLCYAVDGQPDKWINADQIVRWVTQHARWRQRMAEDLKYEKRWSAEMRANMLKALDARCEKQRNRLNTWNHQVTAMLVGFAVRQGVGQLIYDERAKGYLDSFPWHDFKQKLSDKLQAAGITLTTAVTEGAA